MANLPPTSYFPYDSTPFAQGLKSNSWSADSYNSDNSYGLNSIKQESLIPRQAGSYSPNKDLYDDNTKLSMMLNAKPIETPRNLDLAGAQQMVDASSKALYTGDPMRDAHVDAQRDQAKQDLSQIYHAKDPDAVAAAIMSQPGYETGSFMGGMASMGLAVMSGASPMEAFQAGIQGQEYFDAKDRKSRMSDYLKQSTRDLLDAGYSPNSISAAIAEGDNSLLKMRQLSPEEKRAQELSDETRANSEWDRRTAVNQENSALNDQRSHNYRMEETQNRATSQGIVIDGQTITEPGIYKDKIGNTHTVGMSSTGKLNDKVVGGGENWEPSRSDSTTERGYGKAFQTKFGDRETTFNIAQKNIDAYSNAKTDAERASSFRLAAETAYKAIQGSSTAKVEQKDIDELTGRPGYFQLKGDQIVLASGGVPSQEAIDYLQAMISRDREAVVETIRDEKYSRMDQLIASGKTPAQAAKLINAHWRAGEAVKPEDYLSYRENNKPQSKNKVSSNDGEQQSSTPANKGAVGSNNVGGNQAQDDLNAALAQIPK
ncbi:hypothetical protein [Enterobacter pseudoroggenkampii]|uniref:hypothetical protein n=1 Tax=Enterobacter pseudoroggenkampii TaxID=2996112 RepID=UPI0022640447|nr:hypothetical protein [Enterobacter pseudoroggenkampii]MCX8289117.1 hypothetical protein [Enterobacter pseudoroggenkampii]